MYLGEKSRALPNYLKNTFINSYEGGEMYPHVWLIGVGSMALDYAKVLNAQNIQYLPIGRGENSARRFEEKTHTMVTRGGIEKFIEEKPQRPEYAIVNVGVDELKRVTLMVLNYGVKKVLVEKPGGLNRHEIKELGEQVDSKKAEVYIAYNRRFYSSVQTAKEIIEKDDLTSFHFEFTEWSHEIEKLDKAKGIKENWFLANSTHVVDMAFYLGGKPEKICCYSAGSLNWHPAASVFTGAGTSETGALFSYHANWQGPGRWGVEAVTKNYRLIFRPLEKLQIQKQGSVNIDMFDIDDKLDVEYKPGLYKQVEAFLQNKRTILCSIKEQMNLLDIFDKMANY